MPPTTPPVTIPITRPLKGNEGKLYKGVCLMHGWRLGNE
jgi:hypothetical protein